MRYVGPFIKLFLTVLLLIFTALYSDEISDRERELNDVQKLLETQQRLVQEAEAKRASAVQSKQQTQQQYNTIQSRINDLNKTQQQLRNSLEQAQIQKNKAEDRISKVQFNRNQAMLYLLLADQAETRLNMTENDNFFLGLYTKNLIHENKKLDIEITKIASDSKARQEEINMA
ncbi:MAG: hypothetical protein FWG20_02565, partial [Candidatus Cloacimonetes bacterium]|nr:hypothetical protein [Candidatus Cloacimonadota bacterium]